MALIRANKSYEFIIVEDLEEEAFNVIDTGKARGAKDILSANNIKYANNIATIAGMVMTVSAKGINGLAATSGKEGSIRGTNIKRNHNDVLNFVKNTPELEEEFPFVYTCYCKFRAIPINILACLYHFMLKKSQAQADYFLTKFAEGDGLEKEDPIYVLRNQLIQAVNNSKHKNTKEKVYLFISAWNTYRLNKKVSRIAVHRDRPLPEIA